MTTAIIIVITIILLIWIAIGYHLGKECDPRRNSSIVEGTLFGMLESAMFVFLVSFVLILCVTLSF